MKSTYEVIRFEILSSLVHPTVRFSDTFGDGYNTARIHHQLN